MATSRVHNFTTCVQGADWQTPIWLTDDNDAVKDLTNYTARMQIRDEIGGQVYATLDTTTGEIIISAALGKILLYLTNEQTALITREHCVYDLFVFNGSGVPDCLIYGNFITRQRVTI